MVRFLHTADWHLGIRYAHLGHSADRAREIRIETAKRLMNAAKDSDVDFIIVAGDLFDSNDVDRRLLDTAVDIIRGVAPLPVYILPGNHDPLRRDSLYLSRVWDSLDNALILRAAQPVEIPGIKATLYPCPVTQKRTRRDLTEWIKATGENISIGIAHGNLQIAGLINEPNFPVDPERAAKSGLDYLALGEWHSLFTYSGTNGSFRTVYPGTPETTKFGEKDSGKAVIATIEKHGAKPLIQEITIGTLCWEEWTRELVTGEDIAYIEKELNTVEKPENSVITLYVKGITEPEVIDCLDSFETRYSNRFLYFKVVQEQLHVRPHVAKLKVIIPEGAVFGKVAEALVSLMRCHPTLQEYVAIAPQDAQGILRDIESINSASRASPEVLERALLLLYKMAKDTSG